MTSHDAPITEVQFERFEKSAEELMVYETTITDILKDYPRKVDWQIEELEGMAIGNPRAVQRRGKMDQMIYPKSKVLKALNKNREAHTKIVREAQKGYREKAIELTEQLLKDLKAGKSVSLHIPLAVPENHIDDFDRAIQMLEMGVGKNVTLDQSEFQCYVRNKWQWQHHFLQSNAAYSETAHGMFTSEN
jgi:ribosomal protein L25 (general stress protein Ctc)